MNKDNKKIIRIGQASTCGQCGLVYSVHGVFPSICAGTHGYCFGYILEKTKDKKENK